jgi:hypothetical protein
LNIKKGLGSLSGVFIKGCFSISLEKDWAGRDGLEAHNFLRAAQMVWTGTNGGKRKRRKKHFWVYFPYKR